MDQAGWQSTIDRTFPAGAVVQVNTNGKRFLFKTTGMTVTGMAGEVPIVRFWDSSVDRDFIIQMKTYELVRNSPVPVARVESRDGAIFMFGGGLTPETVPIGWMATRRVERDTALEFAK